MVYTSHFGDFIQLIQASSQELSPRAKQLFGRGTIRGGRELMGRESPPRQPPHPEIELSESLQDSVGLQVFGRAHT